MALSMVPIERGGHVLTWRVPGSKSITNRALLLAALTSGVTLLRGVLHSDDTKRMRLGLQAVGIDVFDVDSETLEVHGGIERLKEPKEALFVGNSGTTVRFLCALAVLVPGTVTLVGDEHMAKRPLGDLLGALGQLGVDVECETGCPPVSITGKGEWPGGVVRMPGNKSSQYFSALMLSGAFSSSKHTDIHVDGNLVSLPYVEMTMKMVKQFGGNIEKNAENNFFRVNHKENCTEDVSSRDYTIEPDASSASYPFALAAATGSKITVPNLGKTSMQGDIQFVRVLEKMGCTVEIGENETTVIGPAELQGIEVDMHHISDTVMTLAAISPLCKGPVMIKNVANIRIKETDRLFATVKELQRLGQTVTYGEDWLKIVPTRPIRPAEIECYSDHRMAMSFGILGKVVAGITITDPECTAKTYPDFWKDLERVCSHTM